MEFQFSYDTQIYTGGKWAGRSVHRACRTEDNVCIILV